MHENKLKSLWASGGQAINGWLGIANTFTAEIMANQAYDALTIDMQHGAVDYPDALQMMQAMWGRGPTILARVPWLEPGAIMKAMDGGAMGIICPMVSTRDQAEEFVSYMRYPPVGSRSSGPTRARYAYDEAYMTWANDQVLAMAQVETGQAMDNLSDLVTTPGLDAVYVGPSDLALGMSNGALPGGLDREEPEMIEAIQHIVATAHDAGIKAVLHTATPDYARRGLDWGYDMVTLGSDVGYLATGAAKSIQAVRGDGEAGVVRSGY